MNDPHASPPSPRGWRAWPRWKRWALILCGGALALCAALLALAAHLFTGGPPFPAEELPPAAGAAGESWRVIEVAGIPLLLHGELPYPTDLERPEGRRLDLGGAWELRLDPEERGLAAGWQRWEAEGWEPTQVPATFNAPQGAHPDYEGVAWFRRRFDAPALPAGAWARLCFRGVLLRSQVWLNGEPLGQREGGYTPFYFDLSQRLRPGANELVLRCDNRLTQTSLPPQNRADQRPGWAPYGGIYRPVYLELLPPSYLAKLALTPRGGAQARRLEVQSVLHCRQAQALTLRYRLLDPQGKEVLRGERSHPAQAPHSAQRWTLQLPPGTRAWSPRDPALYRLALEVRDAEGQLLERVEARTGLREIELAGRELRLDGRPLFLRGLAKHEDHPRHGASVPPELDRGDWDALQAMGLNFVRLSHYPHAAPTIREADRRGILLMSEVPFYQAGMGWLAWAAWDRRPWTFPYARFGLRQLHDPRLLRNAQLQLIEMIERDRNAPSILSWAIGNECYTLGAGARPAYRWLREVVRRFDPNRPVTYSELTYALPQLDAARQAGEEVDFVSLNLYHGWYYGAAADAGPYLDAVAARFPEKALLITECGAGSGKGRTPEQGVWPGEGVPAGKDYSEAFQAQTLETIWGAARAREAVVGFTPWLFQDFRCPWFPKNPVPGYNCKGVVTREREPKLAYETLQRLYREAAGQK